MQETLHFEITINAPVKKVWDTMLQSETYKQWAAVFEPTSHYEGSWEKGSKMKFLGAGSSGMVSEVVENKPHEFISVKSLGLVKNGVEDTTSEEAKKWGQMVESYTFIDKGRTTELKVGLEADTPEKAQTMKEMFEGMWPKALEKLKELCEK